MATKQGPRWLWFPILWLLLVLGGAALFQLADVTQDYKNTVVGFSIPVALLGPSVWAAFFGGLSRPFRWLLGLGPWLVLWGLVLSIELVNDGDLGIVDWRWRWQPKPDEMLPTLEASQAIDRWSPSTRDYPRFLGTGYWAEVDGVELQPDWQAHPPQEIWRKEIGAGWSAFAIVGDYAITQEQRGSKELVTCYELLTGEIVWTHADGVRFDPGGGGAFGGVGPRATPTVADGRVYCQGATGIVNCLDARTGKLIWSHDTLAENQIDNLAWGKSCSPLVIKGEDGRAVVVVSVGASGGRSLIAYDAESGTELWAAGDRRSSYASPVLSELLGEPQILVVNEDYVTAHSADDGNVLWEFPWPGSSDADANNSQPVPVGTDRVFLSKGYGTGSALLQLTVDKNGEQRAEPIWQRPVMKTKMSNIALRDSYVYGLDGGVLQCIELASGKSQWKKRRRPAIGHGQNILVGDKLLLLSESGELILVEASPEAYRELASIRVFPDDQVTWNNPALAPPYLLVRNGEEAACYELPLLATTSQESKEFPKKQDQRTEVP